MQLRHRFVAELHAWSLLFRTPTLGMLLVLTATALFGLAQLPLHDMLDVGVQEGYSGDLPELRNIHTPQESEHGTYRWTRDTTSIVMPGVGKRTLLVEVALLPMGSVIANERPPQVALLVGDRLRPLASLPIRAQGATYTILIPAESIPTGQLTLQLHSATFSPPDDPRQLGVPLDYVAIHTIHDTRSVVVMPDWVAVGAWVVVVMLAWAMVQRVLDATTAAYLIGVATLAMLLAAWLDPVRWAYGAQPALATAAMGYLLTSLLWVWLPPLAHRLAVPLHPRTLGWLSLVIVIAFGVRYGGRLYPQSMHGDIHFHTHRLFAAIGDGVVFQLSHHRGVKIPYPTGGYILVAPLVLLFNDPREALPWAASLLEALSTALVCFIVLWSMPNPTSRRSQQTSIVAAALYGLTAAGIMASWWSFATHIYTQALWLMLVAALVYFPILSSSMNSINLWVGVIGVLLCGVFLGHVGFFVNAAIAYGFLLLWVWGQALRGDKRARAQRIPLTLAYGGALLVVFLVFYRAYLPLITTQLEAAAAEGVAAATQRAPVARYVLWQGLWHLGIIAHFGFFPLLLMPLGIAYLVNQYAPHNKHTHVHFVRYPTLVVLMISTVLVGIGFALLPFVTLSSASTRWLMFCAWAMAVGGAIAFRLIWRCGWAGRVVVLAMGGFVAWNTLVYWIPPMLWRIRPPEPF